MKSFSYLTQNTVVPANCVLGGSPVNIQCFDARYPKCYRTTEVSFIGLGLLRLTASALFQLDFYDGSELVLQVLCEKSAPGFQFATNSSSGEVFPGSCDFWGQTVAAADLQVSTVQGSSGVFTSSQDPLSAGTRTNIYSASHSFFGVRKSLLGQLINDSTGAAAVAMGFIMSSPFLPLKVTSDRAVVTCLQIIDRRGTAGDLVGGSIFALLAIKQG